MDDTLSTRTLLNKHFKCRYVMADDNVSDVRSPESIPLLRLLPRLIFSFFTVAVTEFAIVSLIFATDPSPFGTLAGVWITFGVFLVTSYRVARLEFHVSGLFVYGCCCSLVFVPRFRNSILFIHWQYERITNTNVLFQWSIIMGFMGLSAAATKAIRRVQLEDSR